MCLCGIDHNILQREGVVFMKKPNDKFLTYKGKPLLRKGKVLYYGDMTEEVVAMLTVESSIKFKDIDLSETIYVKLILTDPTVSVEDMIIKSSVRKGLFDALDIARIWIERFNKRYA